MSFHFLCPSLIQFLIYATQWGDWLGTEYVHSKFRKYKSFEEARQWARLLGLSIRKEWTDYSKAGKIPSDIPSNPYEVYQGKGWVSWGDWLGTGYVHPRYRQYKSFEEAREWARDLGIKTNQAWNEYSKVEKLPSDIPSKPYKTYKGRGWTSWPDWLGTRNV